MNSNRNRSNRSHQTNQPRDVKEPIEVRIVGNKKWSASNVISIGSVITNIVMIWITVTLASEARHANKISQDALDLATSNQRSSYNQFESTNSVRLTAVNFDTAHIENKAEKISYYVNNIGQQSADIIKDFYEIIIEDSVKRNIENYFVKPVIYKKLMGIYVTSGSNRREIISEDAISVNTGNPVKNKAKSYYIRGSMIYQNSVTKNYYKWDFIAELNFRNNLPFNRIVSEQIAPVSNP